MAYYTALQTAWNSVTQPPTGVTGTALSSGMTTAQKLAAVNAWTVVGAALPANIPVPTIVATILSSDLLALTSVQLQQMEFVIQGGGSVFAPPGGTIRNVFSSIFAGKQTLTNLATLVSQYDSPVVSWCTANGYPQLAPVDATAAGLI